MRLPLFPQPLGRALKKRSAAPASPPCFRRRRRSAPLLFESTLASPFSKLIKQKLRYPLDTGVLGGRGWISRAALLKTAHWAVFALSSATAPQLFESARSMSPALLQNKNLSVLAYVEVFWWARVDFASRAAKNSPLGCFCAVFCDSAAAVRIHPLCEFNLVTKQKPQRTCIR